MSRMNTGRVIIGGLVAGVAANVLDFVVNGYLMVNESTEMMQRLNLRADQVEHSMWTWLGFDFLYGLLVVFTYAAMRPRFGPGPKTALIAGILPTMLPARSYKNVAGKAPSQFTSIA